MDSKNKLNVRCKQNIGIMTLKGDFKLKKAIAQRAPTIDYMHTHALLGNNLGPGLFPVLLNNPGHVYPTHLSQVVDKCVASLTFMQETVTGLLIINH